jgi:uncharacterized protein YjbK
MVLYKVIYIIQILTKAFIEKHYIQYAMRLQTYCSRKHEAADPLVFNKAPIIHTDSYKTEWYHSEELTTLAISHQNLITMLHTHYEKTPSKWLPMLEEKNPTS